MLKGIIELSLRNRLLVLVVTALIVTGGVYALKSIPLDAIPDLSDTQVIIYTEWPGQAPQIVQDQVTYPLTTKMLSVPAAKVVRGYSYYGLSFVYVIFADGTDPYWARSRVLEYLNGLSSSLPRNVTPRLGPDATGVGWAFMYALNSKQRDLAELRSIQDWFLRYRLASVAGVAEVASVGGFVKQYQITVDPMRLRAPIISRSARSRWRSSAATAKSGVVQLRWGRRNSCSECADMSPGWRTLRKVAVGIGPAARRFVWAMWPMSSSVRDAPGHRRTRRPGRDGRRCGGGALWRRHPQSDSSGEGAA